MVQVRTMKKVFDAQNTIEANLIKNILEQEGIEAYISGEYLQGGMGELPVMGMIGVMVDETDRYHAEQIVQNWEDGKYAIDDE